MVGGHMKHEAWMRGGSKIIMEVKMTTICRYPKTSKCGKSKQAKEGGGGRGSLSLASVHMAVYNSVVLCDADMVTDVRPVAQMMGKWEGVEGGAGEK